MESAAQFVSEPQLPVEEPAASMAVEEPSEARCASVPEGGRQSSSRSAVSGLEVSVSDVEGALVELMRCYKKALKFALDMPVLGRCEVSPARFRWRWGARFYTRLYVETHVRKQLQAIRSRLRLELLGTTEATDTEQLNALEAELAARAAPLLGWRRLFGVITRLPPVAAALPLLSAVAAATVSDDISWHTFRHAIVVLVVTALVVWVLVVWPSIRLGFRVKRAIFCGGEDYRHPFFNEPRKLHWNGFAEAKVYDDAGKLWIDLFREVIGRKQQPAPRERFPSGNVYEAENAVYDALGRRKPSEVPVDILLSLAPYLWCAFSAFVGLSVVQTLVRGDLPPSSWIYLPCAALLCLTPFQSVLQGLRNYRFRPH